MWQSVLNVTTGETPPRACASRRFPTRSPIPKGMKVRAISKAENGFVLVEIIVVSIIVAILAAVAIPMYTGYIKSQRQDVAKNIAQSAAVAANVYFRRTAGDPTVAQLNLFLSDPTKYTVEIIGDSIIVTDRDAADVRGAAAFR
jgi:prepilin-type N-terminal cleavage/methylation domain-containing protein